MFFSHVMQKYKRTSDSLNEGLPIKMTRTKISKKNDSFSIKKIVGSTVELSEKVFFSLDKYLLKIWVETPVFAIQQIEKVLLKCSPRDQTNPFVYCLSFTFHTSYKNGMIGHRGTMSKCSKTIYYKNLSGFYFVQTCR